MNKPNALRARLDVALGKNREDAIRRLAKTQYQQDGEIEIDHYAEISEGDDNGAYVQAWVWVDFRDTPLDQHPDTDSHRAGCAECQYSYDKQLSD